MMMEKPLAVSMEHARAMEAAAKKGGIPVFVNYETTWYPANHEAYRLVHEENAIGELRKIVVHDGHQGPKEIGCSDAFLEWLMRWERPKPVFAVTQQIKPQVYPKVDDEATIVLTYPRAQGIIQASWDWPFNRKDMEIYGRTGYALVPEKDRLLVGTAVAAEAERTIRPLAAPNSDPLSYLAAVVRGEIRPGGLSSLEVNMVATETLEAARESARTGKRIELPGTGAR